MHSEFLYGFALARRATSSEDGGGCIPFFLRCSRCVFYCFYCAEFVTGEETGHVEGWQKMVNAKLSPVRSAREDGPFRTSCPGLRGSRGMPRTRRTSTAKTITQYTP